MDFVLNKQKRSLDVPDDTPLLWVLREELALTGTKFGCGQGLCGACTVHLDGIPIRACITPLSAVVGKEVRTIEGLASATGLHAVQQAWLDLDVVQCGYCQSGQIMSAVALLEAHPEPDAATINAAMTGNICRCGTYPRIRAAILRAAAALKAKEVPHADR